MQCSAETICITSLTDSTILTLDPHIKLWVRDAIDHRKREGFCGKVLMKLPDHTRTDLTSKYLGTACREPQVKPKEVLTNITTNNLIQKTTLPKAAQNLTEKNGSNEPILSPNTFKKNYHILFWAVLVYALLVSVVLAYKVKGVEVCPSCKGRLITFTYRGINSKRCENCEYRRRV